MVPLDKAGLFQAFLDTLTDPLNGALLGTYTLKDGTQVPALDWYTPQYQVESVQGLEVILADTYTDLEVEQSAEITFTGWLNVWLNEYDLTNSRIDEAIALILLNIPNESKASSPSYTETSQLQVLSSLIELKFYYTP